MDARRVCLEHFKNLHNIGRNEEVIVNACGFNSVKSNRYEVDVIGRVKAEE